MLLTIRRNVLSAGGQTIVQTVVLLLLYKHLLASIGVIKLGVWSVILATVSVSRFSELGLSASVTKFVARYTARKDDEVAARLVQTAALTLAGALGIALLALAPALVWALPHFLPPDSLADGIALLPFALASLWINSIAGAPLGALDGCLRVDLRAVVTMVASVFFLVLCYFTAEPYGLMGVAIAQVAQALLLLVSAWFVLKRVLRSLPPAPVRWDRALFREMIGYGVTFQVNSIAMLLFEPTTKVLFSKFGGLEAAGYFEMAERMILKVRALIVESNRALVPVFAGLHETDPRSTGLAYGQNVRLLRFLITPVYAALAALAPAIAEMWIGQLQPKFVALTVVVSAAWFVNTLGTPAYFAYLGTGKLRWLTVGHLVMGVSNLALGVPLGQLLGWQGVLAAFAISLSIGSLIPMWAFHRENVIDRSAGFSKHDLVLSLISLGMVVLLLSIYSSEWASHMSTWVRVMSSTVAVSLLLLGVAWFHPMRRTLASYAKTGLGRISLAK